MKRKGIFFIFLLNSFVFFAQELALVRENGLIGYIDQRGEYAIQPRFKTGKNFSNGLAPIKKDNLWGFIDPSGEWVLAPEYEKANFFNSGIALVMKNGIWCYIDKAGNVLKTPNVDRYYDFQNEGVAIFKQNNAMGLIDTTGTIIVDPQFSKIEKFVNGHAVVGNNNMYGIIDSKGEIIVPLEYDKIGHYHPKVIWASKGGNYGLINNGIFKPIDKVNEIWDFTAGSDLTVAKRKGKFGFINSQGEWVIEAKYKEAKSFNIGFAPVGDGKKWGIIDETGKLVMPYRFDDIKSYGNNGLAAVMIGKQWGFMNRKCAVVIPLKYQITPGLPGLVSDSMYASGFFFGAVRVKSKGNWGFLNKKGELIGDRWFQNAEPFTKVN